MQYSKEHEQLHRFCAKVMEKAQQKSRETFSAVTKLEGESEFADQVQAYLDSGNCIKRYPAQYRKSLIEETVHDDKQLNEYKENKLVYLEELPKFA